MIINRKENSSERLSLLTCFECKNRVVDLSAARTVFEARTIWNHKGARACLVFYFVLIYSCLQYFAIRVTRGAGVGEWLSEGYIIIPN